MGGVQFSRKIPWGCQKKFSVPEGVVSVTYGVSLCGECRSFANPFLPLLLLKFGGFSFISSVHPFGILCQKPIFFQKDVRCLKKRMSQVVPHKKIPQVCKKLHPAEMLSTKNQTSDFAWQNAKFFAIRFLETVSLNSLEQPTPLLMPLCTAQNSSLKVRTPHPNHCHIRSRNVLFRPNASVVQKEWWKIKHFDVTLTVHAPWSETTAHVHFGGGGFHDLIVIKFLSYLCNFFAHLAVKHFLHLPDHVKEGEGC